MGFAIAVTLGSKFRRTHDRILPSHMRRPTPGGPGHRINIFQKQGSPIISPGTGFPFRRLLEIRRAIYGGGILTRLHTRTTYRIRVRVIWRPTVSWQVRLGVGPPLGQMARFWICMSDNYFLSSSCRAPSLTRERVCNLQCNHAQVRVA
jgi:hypothetical protein